MLKLGIIGYPLDHTLSPVMHTAALQYLNISGSYRAFEVGEEELEKVFNQLKDSGFKGFNVTIPHKVRIIKLLDELSDTAKLIGAVNTVTFTKEGKARGDNTDLTGFWDAIPDNIKNKIQNEDKSYVSVLGCGGSAFAVCVALLINKTKNLKIYGRNTEKLKSFKQFVVSTSENLKKKINIETEVFEKIDLKNTFMLINTTPVGMYPDTNKSPIPPEKLKMLSKDAFIYDIIYNPQKTFLLNHAENLGLFTLNGVEMLIRQGAASLGIWLEQKIAPLGVMKLAVEQSLLETEETV